jgi:hypothetical protein
VGSAWRTPVRRSIVRVVLRPQSVLRWKLDRGHFETYSFGNNGLLGKGVLKFHFIGIVTTVFRPFEGYRFTKQFGP